MRKRILLLILLLGVSFATEAQLRKSRAPKYSIGRGTVFGYFGINRATFSSSDLHLTGGGYDFTMKGFQATDVPFNSSNTYLQPVKSFQYNARLGYFFKDNWAIAIGVDHLKYAMRDSIDVLLNGNIDSQVGTPWSGVLNNQKASLSKNDFFYGNINGQYYVHAEGIYSVYMYRSDNGGFAIPALAGIGLGGILSSNDFRFGGQTSLSTMSMSGIGVSGQLAVRLEFFNYLFLQIEGSGGRIQQFKVQNRSNDVNAFAKQGYWYGMLQLDLGINLYFRSKNACDSCPKW